MSESFTVHVCGLLENFTNPNNEVRGAAEREYMSLEEANKREIIASLIAICELATIQTVRVQAVLRLLAIFREPSQDPEQQVVIGVRLLQVLEESSMPDSRKEMIVSVMCDCLPAMLSGERALIPDILNFFNHFAVANFCLAVPFLAEWFRLHRDDGIYNYVFELFQKNPAAGPREIEMMIFMGFVRCEVHSALTLDGIGVLLDQMVQLPDDNFHVLLLHLEKMFEQLHKDFHVAVLEKILVMLLSNAQNNERSKLIRVQCLYAFGEFVLTSHNCKQIIWSNHEQVMGVISACLSECARYEDLYKEAKSMLHCVMRTAVGEEERRTYENAVMQQLETWRENPFVTSALLKYLYDLRTWPLALELIAIDETHVRENAVPVLVSMISLWDSENRPDGFAQYFKDTLEVAVTALSQHASECFYDLYGAICQYVEPDMNAKVVEMLLNVSHAQGSSSALKLCSKIKDYLSDEAKHSCVLSIVQLGMARYKTLGRDDDLIAIGGVFRDLPRDTQDALMCELTSHNSEELLSSRGFSLIIEGLGENAEKYVKDILEYILKLVERPLTCVTDGKCFVYPSEELRMRASLVDLVHCIADMSHDLCFPHVEIILQIIDKLLQSPTDIETRRSVITLFSVVVEICAERDPSKTGPLIQKSVELLATECDFIPMKSLVGVLLFEISMIHVPDEILQQIAKAVVTASINLHKIMLRLKDNDDYEDDLSIEYLSQLVEDIPQIFGHIFQRSVRFGVHCCKHIVQNIPRFNDTSASWVVRALSAHLWVEVIQNVENFKITEELFRNMISLLSEEHWFLKQTGVVCLSVIFQKIPFCEATEEYLQALVDMSKSGDFGSCVAMAKLGENLNYFLEHINIERWLTIYVSLLQSCRDSGKDLPDDAYISLLHLVARLEQNPHHGETVSGLVQVLGSVMKGVVGETAMAELPRNEQSAPVIVDLVHEMRAS